MGVVTFDNHCRGSQTNHSSSLCTSMKMRSCLFHSAHASQSQKMRVPLSLLTCAPFDRSPKNEAALPWSRLFRVRSPFSKIKGCWGRRVHSYAEHTNAAQALQSDACLRSESIRVLKSVPLSVCAGRRCVTWTVSASVSWGYTLLSSSKGSLPSAPLPCGLWEWLCAPLLCFL